MKCAAQIHSLIAGNIGSYAPTIKTAAKNITGVSKTTPYTMTWSSPLQFASSTQTQIRW